MLKKMLIKGYLRRMLGLTISLLLFGGVASGFFAAAASVDSLALRVLGVALLTIGVVNFIYGTYFYSKSLWDAFTSPGYQRLYDLFESLNQEGLQPEFQKVGGQLCLSFNKPKGELTEQTLDESGLFEDDEKGDGTPTVH